MVLDDGILDHPKFIRAVGKAGSAALHLWLGMMSWCKQQLTDGIVPVDVLPKINGPSPRWRQRALDALIDAELVEQVDPRQLRLHDFLDWNKSRQQVQSESAVRKHAAKARRDRMRAPPDDVVTTTREHTDDVVTTTREQGDDAPTSERRQAVLNENAGLDPRVPTPYPSHPYPSHPDPDPDPTLVSLGSQQSAPAEPSQPASTSEARRGKPRKPRARTQCPADLQPDPTTLQTAWELGFSDELRERVLREFVNYWRGEGALKADWQATLRNRLDNRAEHYGLKPRKPRDERWSNYQLNLRKSNEPVKDPVKPPADFDQALGGLFGG